LLEAAMASDGPISTGGDPTIEIDWFYWQRTLNSNLKSLRGHPGRVRTLTFSRDGSRLATAGADQTIRVWDTATGQESLTLKGHTDSIRSLAFNTDGSRLVSVSDNTARVWDMATGLEIVTFKGHDKMTYSARFSPDGSRIVSHGGKEVRVWNSGRPRVKPPIPLGSARIA
jgi:WD40 repeat protein